jgi:HK97 family phage major capsid protein
MEADFKALAKELEIGQAEMAAGPIPDARGKELDEKAAEMEALQKHIDQYNRVAGIVRDAKKVDSPTLPGTDGQGRNTKSVTTTPGHMFIASEAFRKYRAGGKQDWSAKVDIRSIRGGRVQLHGEEAAAFEAKAFDPSQLSDLGVDAFIPEQRDPDLVRYEEPEILSIRDVLNVVPATSDTIRYVRHTATARAAASQASRGAPKGYLTITADTASVSVETIAVLSKVTEQDIDDAPRLVGYINGEMRLDVKVKEEDQLLWGTGLSGQLEGLFVTEVSPGVKAIAEFARAQVGDTTIDLIRRMRTDLRKNRMQPNFVTIDPLDWEEVELAKGSDTHYLWGLISDLRGPRIWSLRVVESDAMTHPTTNERRILMGDGIRGATIYDKHDVRLAVGYVNDDFERNLRTLRAEERIALALKRSWAFEYAVTAEASS